MSTRTTRRHFLRLIVVGSGGAFIAACSQPPAPTAAPEPASRPAQSTKPQAPAASKTGPKINVPAFAGVWFDGLKDGVIPCYREKTGGDAEIVAGSIPEWMQKIVATKDKPALDVLIGTNGDVYRAIELGIVEKLDPAKVPNMQGILPRFRDPFDGYAFSFGGSRDGLAYNKDKVKNPPTSWIEFTERVVKGDFGRAVMYPHITNTDSLVISWLINRELGGSVTDPGPFFRRMKEMRPNILKFYVSNADPGTALTRGEIDIAAWTDGRTFGVQASNPNIEFKLPDPGSPILTIAFMKVKNGSEGAWEYLNCAADPKNQAAWNKYFPGYYLTHKDVEYPAASKAKQDPSALDRTFKNWIETPWQELAKAWPLWIETWTKEIGA